MNLGRDSSVSGVLEPRESGMIIKSYDQELDT